jgi:hypothetical protein
MINTVLTMLNHTLSFDNYAYIVLIHELLCNNHPKSAINYDVSFNNHDWLAFNTALILNNTVLTTIKYAVLYSYEQATSLPLTVY